MCIWRELRVGTHNARVQIRDVDGHNPVCVLLSGGHVPIQFISGRLHQLRRFVRVGRCVQLCGNCVLHTHRVLAVCLRIQTNPQNKQQFPTISPERAFGDYIFANVILHLVVANFLG
jgi:hypothetical protein